MSGDWVHTRRGVALVEGTLPGLVRAIEGLNQTLSASNLTLAEQVATCSLDELGEVAKIVAERTPGEREPHPSTPEGRIKNPHNRGSLEDNLRKNIAMWLMDVCPTGGTTGELAEDIVCLCNALGVTLPKFIFDPS